VTKPRRFGFDPAPAPTDLDAALDPDDEADLEFIEQIKEIVIGEAAVSRQSDPARRDITEDQLKGAFDDRQLIT